jgi:hypothetical protein
VIPPIMSLSRAFALSHSIPPPRTRAPGAAAVDATLPSPSLSLPMLLLRRWLLPWLPRAADDRFQPAERPMLKCMCFALRCVVCIYRPQTDPPTHTRQSEHLLKEPISKLSCFAASLLSALFFFFFCITMWHSREVGGRHSRVAIKHPEVCSGLLQTNRRRVVLQHCIHIQEDYSLVFHRPTNALGGRLRGYKR